MPKATRFSGVASFFSEGAAFFSGSAATTQATPTAKTARTARMGVFRPVPAFTTFMS